MGVAVDRDSESSLGEKGILCGDHRGFRAIGVWESREQGRLWTRPPLSKVSSGFSGSLWIHLDGLVSLDSGVDAVCAQVNRE